MRNYRAVSPLLIVTLSFGPMRRALTSVTILHCRKRLVFNELTSARSSRALLRAASSMVLHAGLAKAKSRVFSVGISASRMIPERAGRIASGLQADEGARKRFGGGAAGKAFRYPWKIGAAALR